MWKIRWHYFKTQTIGMVCYAALLWRLVTLPQCVAWFSPGPELLQYYSHGCYKMRCWQICRGSNEKCSRLVGPLCGWLPCILSSSFPYTSFPSSSLPPFPSPPLSPSISTWALLGFSCWAVVGQPCSKLLETLVVKGLHAGFWLKAEFFSFSEGQGSCHT